MGEYKDVPEGTFVSEGTPARPGEEHLPAELRTYGIMDSNGYKILTHMGMHGGGGITSEGFD
jgi:hypothetical protein